MTFMVASSPAVRSGPRISGVSIPSTRTCLRTVIEKPASMSSTMVSPSITLTSSQLYSYMVSGHLVRGSCSVLDTSGLALVLCRLRVGLRARRGLRSLASA